MTSMLKLFKKKKFDIEALIASSVEGLQLVTKAHQQAWRLGQEQSWKVDEDAGRIAFGFSDGVVVSAAVQIVGTFDVKKQTFIWAWQHPSVVSDLRQHAARVKAFAEEYGSKELAKPQAHCTEKRAWEYTALAMLLAEANGAYRVQTSLGTFVFMTFGEVTILRKKQA
jgi:hypothetical protein